MSSKYEHRLTVKCDIPGNISKSIKLIEDFTECGEPCMNYGEFDSFCLYVPFETWGYFPLNEYEQIEQLGCRVNAFYFSVDDMACGQICLPGGQKKIDYHGKYTDMDSAILDAFGETHDELLDGFPTIENSTNI